MPLSTYVLRIAALTLMAATPGPLYHPTLILFQNNLTPDANTPFSALTVATFSGYANVAALAFGTPYIDINGVVRIDAPSQDFIATDGVTPNTIYGWALVDAGLTEVYYTQLLDPPVPLTVASQGVSILPSIPWGA